MVFFEKSQPKPDSLITEKDKLNGSYKCNDVFDRLKKDFKNKCYICEYKEPTSINVEHFKPHKGDKNLKFDWDNLFLSCAHCNNTKLGNYDNILNCTDINQDVERKLRYYMKSYPKEKVEIEAQDTTPEVLATKQLLDSVYNGTTNLKILESSNLRNKILNELVDFQKWLLDYYHANTNDMRNYACLKIQAHLSRASNFTAFKRWIILDNEALKNDFEQYFD